MNGKFDLNSGGRLDGSGGSGTMITGATASGSNYFTMSITNSGGGADT